ncbi:ABC transporter substrate-binding protein [Lyngbya aestuarii]|uniref:ABC transporter substrate-binding protein n=1 Tax=Lyngbya aestuarii TaxID=118322 RepID=UPI000417F912|nr:ABC transporter substrate-binding protein [Lyngbya aestuarii]
MLIFSATFSVFRHGLKTWGVILLSLCLLICGGCQTQTPTEPGVTHLTLWHGINPPPNRDVFQKLVDQFNQTHPKIQVDAYYVGQPDQQMPKILTAIVGNASPDILWYAPQITGQLVELDAIQPLENWLDESPRKAEIDPALFEAMELNGHTWSIPMATNNTAIFYRPSLFEKAGITKLPLTWEEFRVTAGKLTSDLDGDGKLDQHGIVLPLGKGEWTVFTWLPFMYSAEGELIDRDEVDLVNPGAIAALQFWSDLITDGSAILSGPERGYEQDNFISGKVAMQITGPWTLGFLQSAGIDYGVFPIPAKDQQATVVGGEHLFVMKTTPQQQKAALTFLDYVLSEDFQTEWSLGTGYLPVNLKTRQSQKYQDFLSQQPSLQVFLKQMAWARTRPIIAGYRRLSENLGRAIEASLLGENPQDALKQAENRLKLMI